MDSTDNTVQGQDDLKQEYDQVLQQIANNPVNLLSTEDARKEIQKMLESGIGSDAINEHLEKNDMPKIHEIGQMCRENFPELAALGDQQEKLERKLGLIE